MVLPEVQTTPNDPGTTIGIRLLHTDSGHYLVPVTTDNDAAPTLYNSLAAKIYKRLKPLLPNGSLSNGGRSESQLFSCEEQQQQQQQHHSQQQIVNLAEEPKGLDGRQPVACRSPMRTEEEPVSSHETCGPSGSNEDRCRSPGADDASGGLKSSPGGDPATVHNHNYHVNNNYYDDVDDDEAMPRDNDKCDICHTPTNNDSLARCIECHTSACLNCMTDTQRCVLCSEMIDGLEDYYNNIYNSDNNLSLIHI